jgi:hypothetical protein
MRTGRGTAVAAAVTASVLGLAFAGPASAATVTVNDDAAGNPADVGPPGVDCSIPPAHTSIGAANAAAAAGDTIAVCSGTYGSATLTKQLTLLGAQAGVDARTRAVPVAQESVVSPSLSVGSFAGTTVDGFSVSGDAASLGLNFGGPPVGGSTIVNNILSNHRRAIQLASASGQTRVAFNRFSNNGKSGTPAGAIYTGGVLNNVTIEDNVFDDTAGPSGVIQINPTTGRSAGIRILRNEFTNVATNVLVMFETDDAEISGNSVSGGNSTIFYLGGDNAGTEISGNTVGAGTASAVGLTNLGFPNTNSGVTISGNDFSGRLAAVTLGSGGHTGGGLSVTRNRIVGNTNGVVSNDASEPVSAVNNWWGCNDGPGAVGCDPVAGTGVANVDFDPWLALTVSAAPNSVEIGGNDSTITASLNLNSDGASVGTIHPDGFPVAWSTDLGTIAPASSPLASGLATSTLTSGLVAGTANPAATVDNATVSTPVAFTDTSFPDTQIDSGPANGSTIAQPTATFAFSSPDDPAATFECRLDSSDDADFAACTSPFDTPALSEGVHVFEVRAVDSNQNPDPTPARVTFVVDTTPDAGGVAGAVGESKQAGACSNRIRGTKGNDSIDGTAKGDRVLGIGGDDDLRGGAGYDCLKGGAGDDTLDGGTAGDILQGGPGSDLIRSRDGKRDKVNCGAGVDVVLADQRDVVKNCESVRLRRQIVVG